MRNAFCLTTQTLLAAAVALASSAAHADRTINVDGDSGDWAGVTSCFSEPRHDSPSSVDLVEVCLENDNSSGNNGNLYTFFNAANPIPTKEDTWFGFSIDVNNDGAFTSVDELWVAFFKRNSKGFEAFALEVRDPTNFATIKRTYSSTTDCGGPAGANGWAALRGEGENNEVVEIRVAYGCLGLSFGTDTRMIQVGTHPSSDTTTISFYDGTNGMLGTAAPPPEVERFVARSGPNQNTLIWTNPSPHEGVVILRAAGAVPSTAPTKGTTYTAGQTIGNAVVVYADGGGSTVSTFTDTGLTNGTVYHYKIYNHHQIRTYSSGNAPSANGLKSIPTSGVTPEPAWCYSFGAATTMQPMLELGAAVFLANNSGTVTANNLDGTERFRPVRLNAGIQSRFLVVPLAGRTGTWMVAGDMEGYTYVISAQSGVVEWVGNGGAPIGTRIGAQPAVQLYQYSNAAFQAANPGRDLIFFATRNSSTTNNRVVALSSVTGEVVWSYAPGNLDIISGGMLVDRTNNRLWVASRSGGGAQASVRVLSTLSGTLQASYAIGDVDHPIAWGYKTNEAFVTTNDGVVYAYDLATLAPTWSYVTGPQANYAFPTNDGFIASLTGSVQRYKRNATTGVHDPLWAMPPTIAYPTGVRIEYVSQKLLVGDNAGTLHQVDVANGALEKSIALATDGLGTPTIDPNVTIKRLYIGGIDGRLCAVDLPL